ncbi:DMT family transporter [Ekhidna sp. To15]|uniref:DMT family transporter n=1 Tax=Ekhidna sp. To15 TaxID=3395267 RepID=UPI003F51BD0A
MKIKNIHLLILLASLWGPSFLFIKIAVLEIPPIMLAALRIGIAAVILNILLALKNERLPLDPIFWKRTFIAGLFAQAIPFVLINWGEQFVDSSLASILNGLMPLFTIIFAHFIIADERLTGKKLFGVTLGFLGLIVLVMPSIMGGVDGSMLGIMAITAAAVSYGIGLSYIRKYFANTPSFKAPAAQLLSVTIYLVPLAFIMNPEFNLAATSIPALSSLFILAFFGTAIAFIVYFRLIERSSAGYASLVTYLMPIYGVILGVAFLGEEVSIWMILGAVLILLGIRETKKSTYKKRQPFGLHVDTALYSKFR